MNCAICNHPDATGEVWVYSHRKGGDVFYPVCAFCLRHPKHAETIVSAINRKLDAAGGYR